jgi:hypothetical protein
MGSRILTRAIEVIGYRLALNDQCLEIPEADIENFMAGEATRVAARVRGRRYRVVTYRGVCCRGFYLGRLYCRVNIREKLLAGMASMFGAEKP